MTHKKYPYRYAPKQISYTHIRIYCNEKDVELNSKANRGKQKQHKTTSKKERKKNVTHKIEGKRIAVQVFFWMLFNFRRHRFFSSFSNH